MLSASSVSDRLRASLGQRGIAILLTLAFEALLLLLLIFMTPALQHKKSTPAIFGFNVEEGDDAEASRAKATARPKASAKKSASRPTPKPPVPVPTPETPATDVPMPPNFIRMTRSEFRATDIAGMKSSGPELAANDGGAASGRDDSEVASGRGPHGETLYNAEWYSHPTNAQLSTYISKRARESGWGLVACRTAPNFRVEDCQELDESPRGSGLAGSVRQAAWQFRVRPPRKGGKDLVGAWVSIRIDYTIGNAPRGL